jgi:hypothetical protein
VSAHVPLTLNRAATAIVQSRQMLERAKAEINLAIEIIRQLDRHGSSSLPSASKRHVVARSLQEFVRTLEDTQRALTDAWRID